jgi:hypothetical protein
VQFSILPVPPALIVPNSSINLESPELSMDTTINRKKD